MGGRRDVELLDEVWPTNATEALLDVAAFLGLVPEEILPLGEFLLLRLRTEDGLQGVGVVACVPRFCSDGHRRGSEVLYLFQMEVETLGDDGKFCHIFLLAARVGGDEIRDDLLVEILFAIDTVKLAFELIELLERRFTHQLQNTVAGMLWCYLQTTADVTAD